MGGDYYFSKVNDRWSETAVGTNAGVTITRTAPTGVHFDSVTGFQCSGDAAALVSLESPSGTVLWRKRFTAAFTFSEAFPLGAIKGAEAAAVLLKISASTTNCEANIQGFTIYRSPKA